MLQRAAGALLAMLALAGCADPSDCSSRAAMGYALVFAEDAVKRRIPNPHVAGFDFSVYRHLGNGLWKVAGHVDTKNIFGGPVRAYFDIAIQCSSKANRRTWQLKNVSVR